MMNEKKAIKEANKNWKINLNKNIASGNAYYTKLIKKPTEQYKFLRRLLKKIGLDNKKVIDTGAGLGRNLFFLKKDFKKTRFYASDISPVLVKKMRGIFRDVIIDTADVCSMEKTYKKDYFDVTLALSVLSLLPSYEEAIRSLLAVTKKGGYLIICTPMCEGEINTLIKVNYKKGGQVINETWNLWSLPQVRDFALSIGAQKFKAENFEIGIDLPKPKGMGTYTEKLANNKRLQLTGNILLNWKFLVIQK